MKNNSRKTSINVKLSVAFLLALLVPTLLIASNSFFAAKKEISSQIHNSAKQSVATIDDVINQYVSPIVHDAGYFAQTLNVEKEEGPIILERLEQYFETSDGIVSSFIGTTKGVTLQHPDLGLMGNKDFDPRTRDWYKDAMASPNEVIISEPHETASTGDWVVTISKKLDNGQGVFATNLNLASLQEMVTGIEIGKEGYPVLLSEAGTVIAHPTMATGDDKSQEEWAKQLATLNDKTFAHTVDGNKAEVFAHSNELTKWHIGGMMFTKEVDEAVAPILKIILLVLTLSLVVLGAYVYYIIRSIVKPLRNMTEVAEVMSEGDLRNELEVRTRDEIGILSRAFNRMSDMLASIIGHIQNKSSSILAASEELTATTEDSTKAVEQIASSMMRIQEGMDEQAARIQKSVIAMQSVSEDIQSIHEHTHKVTSDATTAEQTTEVGHKLVLSTEQQMRKIDGIITELSGDISTVNDYATQINEIVTVITSISEQTNLLALNAAIEAARAGEHGKGFAVVADEVRKLAEQTNRSTIEVQDIVNAIQRESTRSVDSMHRTSGEVAKGLDMFMQTEHNFLEVKRFIEEINDQLEAVLANAQKIAASSDSVVDDMEEVARISDASVHEMETIAEATEEQLGAMEEITATAETLESSVEELQQEITKFQVK
ncbi:hypothetical protein CH76_05270 [Lysinibacillus sp. BF-4]|uniref:methyl-accepting chemotaxis protein n=1 Tax=Lysinibacillus sp. BF-4 TaxID=1473546 RepID=UPI000503D709|nr:methyl-accepting chemotaxis protein [Lysinibacillus sp. BF-4]KFL43725.1 hypothetical protein CH76_05270 [Lysinibacillus sp. BF-4]